MPTATTTTTTNPTSSLKARNSMNGSVALSSSSPTTPGPSSPNSATLRSMYNRAAKAFLNRDISLTNSLLHSAFTLIPSPSIMPPKSDALCSQRRKWEVLRITMETTIYAAPRNPTDPLPQELREMLIKSPHSLVQSMYTRSLELFTPIMDGQTKRDSAYLPSQVLTTLIYSSLKLDCPDVGRKMIEEWLARWGLIEADSSEDGGYDKVVELYTLQVLPKVQDWGYAREFLDYETELPREKREALKTSLHALHEQYLKSLAPRNYTNPPVANGSSVSNGSAITRSHSPASSSSSLSTTSTHTAVPSTPRQSLDNRNGRPPLASRHRSGSSASVSSSDSTATATPKGPQKRSSSRRSASHNSSSHHSSNSPAHPLRPYLRTQQPVAIHPPSNYSLVKAFFQPYLTTSKISTFFVLFFVFPLVSLFFRRRRRAQAGSGTSGSGAGVATAELVRRRLQATEGVGMVGRVWGEVVKAVLDTVKMGGSGLV